MSSGPPIPGRAADDWVGVLALLGLVVLALPGCVSHELITEPSRDKAAPTLGKTFAAGGACLVLGEAEKPAFPRETFARKVNEMLARDRFESARRFIRRYPDLALETLRNVTSADAGSPALQLVARVYDEQCGSSQPSESWLAFLQDRAAHPDRYAAFERARKQFLDLVREGNTPEAVKVLRDVPAPGTLLAIDADHLLGEAFLLHEKPAEAIAALTRGLNAAPNRHFHHAVQMLLLLGEAQRRAGQKGEGTGTWQQAVLMAGQLASRSVPVLDPILWERASYLRPVQCSWPAPVVRQMVPSGCPVQGDPKTGLEEAWLWMRIGNWHLDRQEPQSALVAFKRAESLNLDRTFQEQMQLSQTRALLQMKQHDAALGPLARLGSNRDSPAAAPALAMLGSVKLSEGCTEQGIALLKKAVEESMSSNWPGQAEAEADLGLADLMTGCETDGLRWLHSGQQRFQAEHNHELLLLSLENEARYFEHTRRPEDAARIRQRMKILEKS